jgi:hypothetical protein
MEEKICCKCKLSKPLNKFGNLKSSKDGLRYDCKDCRKAYNISVRVHKKEYNKKYFEKNKNEILKKHKDYREKNAEKIKIQRKEYRNRSEIKEHIKKKNKAYLEVRKAKIKERRKTDTCFRLSEVVRSKIHKMLSGKKTTKYKDLICCDTKFLKKWIEFQWKSDMNWDNYGANWHIDHIIPINQFDLSKETDKKICFHWRNLQPLYAFDNQSKSDKIIIEHIVNNIENYKKFNKISSKQDGGYQVITEMLLWLRTIDSGMVKNPQMTHYYSDEMDDPQPSS